MDLHLGDAVALKFNPDGICSLFLTLGLVTARTWCNKMDKLSFFCHQTKPEVKNLKGTDIKNKGLQGWKGCERGQGKREARMHYIHI